MFLMKESWREILGIAMLISTSKALCQAIHGRARGAVFPFIPVSRPRPADDTTASVQRELTCSSSVRWSKARDEATLKSKAVPLDALK